MNSLSVKRYTSNFLFSANPFASVVFEIDDTYVTLTKKNSLFSESIIKSIPIRNIVNIQVSKSGTGASIQINSFANSTLSGNGFSLRKALEIKSAIMGMQQ